MTSLPISRDAGRPPSSPLRSPGAGNLACLSAALGPGQPPPASGLPVPAPRG